METKNIAKTENEVNKYASTVYNNGFHFNQNEV